MRRWRETHIDTNLRFCPVLTALPPFGCQTAPESPGGLSGSRDPLIAAPVRVIKELQLPSAYASALTCETGAAEHLGRAAAGIFKVGGPKDDRQWSTWEGWGG